MALVHHIYCPGEIGGRECHADLFMLVWIQSKRNGDPVRIKCPVCGNTVTVDVTWRQEWCITGYQALAERVR
jgi:hypothetical protein